MTRRQFLWRVLEVTLGAGAIGAGGLGYATAVEPDWIDITRITLKLRRLSPAFHGYRMAHISDIHIDDWMRERLPGIVRLINAQQPDLVAITGDFVTNRPRRYAEDMVAALTPLHGRDAVVAVLGNHDHWTSASTIRTVLKSSGIVEIGNRVHTVRRGEASLHVAGVDDYMVRADRLDRVLERLPVEGAAILLVHEPDFADVSAATTRFDLQISGHSHGGQIRLPMIGAPYLPPYARKYPMGLYQVGAMYQYTNRGLGMLGPRIRLNCRPEITVLTLQAG
ncbi:MAG: metallophosphoesterase [Armatimonadota bacterium]